MKTILYQPLFINPQAYFVFPQLYHIEKGDSYVDFGLFKGKHIRISQYTNIGAVVLGEWYIPGTPTPPEPEQPDWFNV